MDQADRYRQLALLGREAFLATSAPGALVRKRGEDSGDRDVEGSGELEAETQVAQQVTRRRNPSAVEVYPLAKKPGASFPDMITVGRTGNNDVVLRDVTVSRLHAFFRRRDERWVLADAGSKNGTAVDGDPLQPRRERELMSGTPVRIGDLELTFYTAHDLFDVLGGEVAWAMSSDWEQRQLCSDGGCVGVIGSDGTCKVCGHAAPNWGDDRQRGMRDPEEADRELEKSKVLAAPEAPDHFDDRALCRDGGCIGVIGDDGRCKVCGLGAVPDAAAESP